MFLALYIPWLDRRALLAGWVVGIGWGTYQLLQEGFSTALHGIGFLGGLTVYIGVSALVANLIVVFLGCALVRLAGAQQSYTPLTATDYEEAGHTS